MAVVRQLASVLLLRQQSRKLLHPGVAFLSTSCRRPQEEDREPKDMVLRKQQPVSRANLFDTASDKEKNRKSFHGAIDLFRQRDTRKRGSVEFIRAAMKNMKQFGVHRDLESYRALVDILPKGKMVAVNIWQKAFFFYPKQQDCITEVLCQMEENRIIPDEEFGEMLENIFGMNSAPFKKYMRMVYWMPKFKNKDPWPVPFNLPDETLELAKLAIERITSVDKTTEIAVYDTDDIAESIDATWIVSGQSSVQRDMIRFLPKTKALYVEGAFRVWLRDSQVNYFLLRGEPVPRPPAPEGTADDVADIRVWTAGERHAGDLVKLPNVHEQEDGTILGCCATGTSTKDSLLSWVRILQRENPDLEDIPILFSLTSPIGPVMEYEDVETAEMAPE